MSTAGAHDPPSAQSSSLPRYWLSIMRLIRSCSVSRSRTGSQRTIAIVIPPVFCAGASRRPSSSVLDRVLGVHDVVAGRRARGRLAARGARAAGGSGGLVERFRELVAERGHAVELLLQLRRVLGRRRLAQLGDGFLDLT